MDFSEETAEALAIYIRYVLRPDRLLHFCTDNGAFARVCMRVGLRAEAIHADLPGMSVTAAPDVHYYDWRQFPVEDTLFDYDDNALVLVSRIPYEGIYFTAPVMAENWIKFGRRLWLMDLSIDRWIIDMGYRSFIVDLDASIHANTQLCHELGKSVLLKRTY